MLKSRYSSLRSQYESDIRRLTFIAEGEIHKENIKKIEYCPFCNGELDLKQSESRMNELQLKLVSVGISDEETTTLSNEIIKLREEKTQIDLLIAEDKGRQMKKEELIAFLDEQTAELDEFDDGLVRRLIEQITVHENGTFTVEFKSGTMVEI